MPQFQTPKAWTPRETWDALMRGEGCPLCSEFRSPDVPNAHGCPIADLRLSRLRLATIQFPASYCILICTRHVGEFYHLAPEERQAFFDDLAEAAQAIERVFSPVKR